MHETSLLNNLIKQINAIARKEQAQKVHGVKVTLGALSHFSKEHFLEHFILASKGGIAEGARLDIELSTDENDPNAQSIILEEVEVE